MFAVPTIGTMRPNALLQSVLRIPLGNFEVAFTSFNRRLIETWDYLNWEYHAKTLIFKVIKL